MDTEAGWLHSANLRIDRFIRDLAQMETERDAARAALNRLAGEFATTCKERDAYEVHRDLVIEERDAARAALREVLEWIKLDGLVPAEIKVIDRWRRDGLGESA